MANRVQQVAIPAPVAELVAAWDDRSADRFVAIMAPDVHVVVPPLHLELHGRDEVWVGVARLFGSFGALRYTSRHRYLAPDSVTDEAVLEGLQTQEFLGAPPPGRPGAVAARVIMQHDGLVITRLELWPDVGALRDLFDGAARRIDLRTAGAAAPVVAALRATIPAPESKLSLGQLRQQPASLAGEGALLPGAPEGVLAAAAARPEVEESGKGKSKTEVPKAPRSRKSRRFRAFLGGLVMLVLAGLLVTYVVTGVRNKRLPEAAAPAKPSPTAQATPATSARPTSKPSASPRPAPTASFNKRTNSFSFSASLLFDLNSAELLPDAQGVLDGVVDRVLSEKRFGTIFVRGYTDDTGTPATNRTLSRQRAEAVATYLEARLDASDFTLRSIGKGATSFVADNTTDAGRAKNRRVEIKVPPPTP